MIYKKGGKTRVWDTTAHVKVIEREDMAKWLAKGWVTNPAEIDKLPLSEPAEEDTRTDAKDMGEISDGYHTFNELYAHRVRLFSTLMRLLPGVSWWSYAHSDGAVWEGWILAGIDTPEGAVTYHLPESEIPRLPVGTELEFGKEWDGHDAAEVLERLLSLAQPEPEPETDGTDLIGGDGEVSPKKRGRKAKATADETDNQG
ncbi:hypothetical protein EHW64_19565 [Erwinia psidii]|nr:hypothetical protein [Erwinia psidii]MCX8963250.1 hypothetical protein [Erwinia psidii]